MPTVAFARTPEILSAYDFLGDLCTKIQWLFGLSFDVFQWPTKVWLTCGNVFIIIIFCHSFLTKKQLRCKMFDEFMYYISNNSPKLVPLPSPRPSTTPPPPPPLMKRTYNCPRVTWARNFLPRRFTFVICVQIVTASMTVLSLIFTQNHQFL